MNDYTEIGEILKKTEYSVLHGWQDLPYIHSSDLDIVVTPEHLNVLEKSLRNFKDGKLVQLIQHESSGFFFVLSQRNGNGLEFLKVDAATDYRRNGYTFFSAEQFTRKRYKLDLFWVASPSMEFPYLLVKKILKGDTPEHQKIRFYELVSDLGIKKSKRIAASLFGKRLGYKLVSWIYANEWDIIDSRLPTLRRALVWHVIKRNPFNPLTYWIMEFKRVLLRFLHPTGLFVVVLGPDGSGKTTLIENIQKELGDAFRRTDVFHLRPSIFGRRDSGQPVTNPHGKPPRSALLSAFKVLYYVSDYVLGYLLSVRTKLVKSSLLIFDRYYDDLLVDPQRYRYGGGKGLLRFLRKFVPKPDLLLVLDVPENDLLSRKQEVSKEELTRQRAAYRELAIKEPNAYILDGSVEREQVTRDASEIIMNHLHERYIKRRKLWFDDDPDNSLDCLNSMVSSDPKNTLINLADSNYINADSEWGIYKKFKYLRLGDGRGYLFPTKRNLFSNALRIYNVQNISAKLFKSISKITGGKWFTKTARLLIRRNLNKDKRKKIYFFEFLKDHLNSADIDFAVSIGTPGPYRKPVIQVMSKEGEIIAYVKLGSGPTNSQIKNEADALKTLKNVATKYFKVPTLLHEGLWENHYFMMQSAPEGRLLSAPKKLNEEYIGVINEFADINTTKLTLENSNLWQMLSSKIEDYKKDHFYSLLKNVMDRVGKNLNNTPLTFHFSHGDFAPWNSYLIEKKLFIYDWEYSEGQALAGWDLFHFIVQTEYLLKKSSPFETYTAVLDSLDNSLTNPYWNKVDINKDTALEIFTLYIINRFIQTASEEEKNIQEFNYFLSIIMKFTCLNRENI